MGDDSKLVTVPDSASGLSMRSLIQVDVRIVSRSVPSVEVSMLPSIKNDQQNLRFAAMPERMRTLGFTMI